MNKLEQVIMAPLEALGRVASIPLDILDAIAGRNKLPRQAPVPTPRTQMLPQNIAVPPQRPQALPGSIQVPGQRPQMLPTAGPVPQVRPSLSDFTATAQPTAMLPPSAPMPTPAVASVSAPSPVVDDEAFARQVEDYFATPRPGALPPAGAGVDRQNEDVLALEQYVADRKAVDDEIERYAQESSFDDVRYIARE